MGPRRLADWFECTPHVIPLKTHTHTYTSSSSSSSSSSSRVCYLSKGQRLCFLLGLLFVRCSVCLLARLLRKSRRDHRRNFWKGYRPRDKKRSIRFRKSWILVPDVFITVSQRKSGRSSTSSTHRRRRRREWSTLFYRLFSVHNMVSVWLRETIVSSFWRK